MKIKPPFNCVLLRSALGLYRKTTRLKSTTSREVHRFYREMPSRYVGRQVQIIFAASSQGEVEHAGDVPAG